MKLLLIVCAALTISMFTMNIFAANKQSFVRNVVDGGSAVQLIPTTDGGYAYLSSSKIIKVPNVSGKKISEISLAFDIPAGAFAWLQEMAQTTDGFVVVGGAEIGGDMDPDSAMVIKLDSEGRIEWNKIFTLVNGSMHLAFWFEQVAATSDGGFVVLGWAYSFEIGTSRPIL